MCKYKANQSSYEQNPDLLWMSSTQALALTFLLKAEVKL